MEKVTLLDDLRFSLAELRADYDRLIAAKVAAERQACARLAEDFADQERTQRTLGLRDGEDGEIAARAIATAIRARGSSASAQKGE